MSIDPKSNKVKQTQSSNTYSENEDLEPDNIYDSCDEPYDSADFYDDDDGLYDEAEWYEKD